MHWESIGRVKIQLLDQRNQRNDVKQQQRCDVLTHNMSIHTLTDPANKTLMWFHTRPNCKAAHTAVTWQTPSEKHSLRIYSIPTKLVHVWTQEQIFGEMCQWFGVVPTVEVNGVDFHKVNFIFTVISVWDYFHSFLSWRPELAEQHLLSVLTFIPLGWCRSEGHTLCERKEESSQSPTWQVQWHMSFNPDITKIIQQHK